MNVYSFELNKLMKSVCIWAVVLVLVVMIFMSGLYPAFADSSGIVREVLGAFSPKMLAALGIDDIDSMFNFEGFYAFSYSYFGVLLAVCAACFAVSSIAREKRQSSGEFLFVRPKSRIKIFFAKYFASFTACLMVFVVFCVVAIVYYLLNCAYERNFEFSSKFVLMLLCGLFTQMLFLSIGCFCANVARKIRSIGAFGGILGVGSYVMYSASQVVDNKYFSLFAPTRYYDATILNVTGSLDLLSVIVAVVFTVLLLTISAAIYCRCDISN